jgi:hypothetical protein
LNIIKTFTDENNKETASNVKFQFLADPSGEHFPWTKLKQQQQQQLNKQQQKMQEIESNIKQIEIHNETETVEPLENKENQIDNMETIAKLLKKQDQTSKIEPLSILNELVANLIPFNYNLLSTNRLDLKNKIKKQIESSSFVYILFGTSKVKSNKSIIHALVEFWKQYHIKHKFEFVYLNFDNVIDEAILNLINSTTWFTLKNSKKDLKVK